MAEDGAAVPAVEGITEITVSGFKSLVDPYPVRIAPLTLLAGANSSGKSSLMQPLLLLKQTLESPFDPGGLLLDGPHVRFTRPDEFVRGGDSHRFEVSVAFGGAVTGAVTYRFAAEDETVRATSQDWRWGEFAGGEFAGRETPANSAAEQPSRWSVVATETPSAGPTRASRAGDPRPALQRGEMRAWANGRG